MVKYSGTLPNLSWFSQVSFNSGIGIKSISELWLSRCHPCDESASRRLISICAVGSLAFTLPLPFSESLVLWVFLSYFLGLTPESRRALCFTSGLFINRILLVFASMPRDCHSPLLFSRSSPFVFLFVVFDNHNYRLILGDCKPCLASHEHLRFVSWIETDIFAISEKIGSWSRFKALSVTS